MFCFLVRVSYWVLPSHAQGSKLKETKPDFQSQKHGEHVLLRHTMRDNLHSILFPLPEPQSKPILIQVQIFSFSLSILKSQNRFRPPPLWWSALLQLTPISIPRICSLLRAASGSLQQQRERERERERETETERLFHG